jgi:UrcA family protein
MTKHTFAQRVTCLATVAAGTLGLSPAFGQQAGLRVEEITVIAPWSINTETVSQTPAGGKTELISLTRHVYYGDLDLAKHADVMTLEKRVNEIAKTTCDQLSKMYPLSGPNPPNCAEKAAASAKAEMDKAIASASKARP